MIASAPPSADPAALVAQVAERRATWLELFFDIVFVAAVAEVAGSLGEHYDWAGLVRFGFLFLLIWWAWIGHTLFATRFDSDDPAQRLLTVGQMFAVAVMAVNTHADLTSREAAGFAAAYAVMRILLAVQYLRVARLPGTRDPVARHVAGIALAASLWLVSSVVPPPARFGLWGVALAVDLLTPLAAGSSARHHPPDASHLPERFGLFTLIVLGEAVVGTMAGMKHQEVWSVPAAASALLALGIAFGLWWAYFDVARGGARLAAPALSRPTRLVAWLVAHLPLSFGLVVAAVGLEHVVLAGGAAPLHGATPWLLSGALGLVAAALLVVGMAGRTGGKPVSVRVLRPLGLVGVTAGGLALAGPVIPGVWLLAALFGFGLLAIGLGARRDAQA